MSSLTRLERVCLIDGGSYRVSKENLERTVVTLLKNYLESLDGGKLNCDFGQCTDRPDG